MPLELVQLLLPQMPSHLAGRLLSRYLHRLLVVAEGQLLMTMSLVRSALVASVEVELHQAPAWNAYLLSVPRLLRLSDLYPRYLEDLVAHVLLEYQLLPTDTPRALMYAAL